MGDAVTEDLAKLKALLASLTDLPPVLDGEEGPEVVKAEDVRNAAVFCLFAVDRLVSQHERLSARLGRYDKLKLYVKELEQKLVWARNRLRIVREVTSL